MGPLLVVPVEKRIEPALLLQEIGRRRLGGFSLERQVHALMPAVLFGMAGFDALDVNAQAKPPHREAAQAVEGVRGREGQAVIAAIARGTPKSLKARSKTANAYLSCVLDRASQVIKYRLAKSVIVNG
jgi:hypothetical protein